jgi:16S rRNA (uracil1498-N3)-methyltransferase
LNLILFHAEEVGKPLPAGDERAQHLLAVLRCGAGDTFDAGIIDGPVGKGRILAVAADEIVWAFEGATGKSKFYAGADPLDPIELVVGLPRPQTARKILFDAAALGVRALRFVATEKGDAGYARSTLWSSGDWRRHLLGGLAQAFATRQPEVSFGESLAEAIEELPDAATLIALDNYEAAVALGPAFPIVYPAAIFIGGERGWSAAERDLLRSRGATLCHLGRRVLRTETACVAALALVRSRLKQSID